MTPLLEDLQAEVEDFAGLLETVPLELATPAEGWDVRATVAHLAGSDAEALKAATRPEAFVAELPTVAADIDGFLQGQLDERAHLTRDELLRDWRHGFTAMVAAFAAVPSGTKVPWYGPPMSPASFATARLMEYWAHGQDVADAAGVQRESTARLRHIAHLGFRTRGFSYAVRGLGPPTAPVRLELTAPDGQTWTWGEGDDVLSGPAVDFCLRVTQRRHRADTALQASGPMSQEWLDVAQCFAGPPGPGRPPQ